MNQESKQMPGTAEEPCPEPPAEPVIAAAEATEPGAEAGAGALGSWGGWLSSVVEVAKERSTQAVDLLKSDFSEFQHETSRVFSECTAVVQEKMRPENRQAAGQKLQDGVTKLWGDFSTMMYTPPDEEDDDIAITAPAYDRFQRRLYTLQCDAETYSTDPVEGAEGYEAWCGSCDLEQRKQNISDLLVHRPEVRTLYTRMVPSSVLHIDFWQRYFYKLHLLEQDEARKLELVRRADITKRDQQVAHEWDDMSSPAPETETPAAACLPETQQAAQSAPDTQQADNQDLTTEQPRLQAVPHITEESTLQAVPQTTEEFTLQAVSEVAPPAASKTSANPAQTQEASDAASSAASEPPAPNIAESALAEVNVEKELKVKERGDMVVVGSSTPSAESSSSNKQDDEEDWEKEFDIEVTEEDMAQAEQTAAKIASGQEEPEDWEKW